MASADRFETMNDIFRSSISNFGGRQLFGTKKAGSWNWTTYKEFGEMVDQFRGALADLGVKRGDLIAVIADNRVEWAVTAYAAFGLGAALVPMYEAMLVKDWEFIAKDCKASMLVVAKKDILEKTKKFFDSVPSLKHIITFEDAEESDSADQRVHNYSALLKAGKTADVVATKKEDIACLIYTSGTTGNPKGVVLSNGNMASNVSAIHEIFEMKEDDRSLSFLPWAHSFGQTCELHALFSNGASIALAESVNKIIDNLAEVQPTLLFSVPRIFNRLYGVVQKQISEKPGVVQAMVKSALGAAKKQREGGTLSFGEGIILGLANRLVFSKVRARFGGRLKFAFSGGAAISRDVAEFIDGIGVMVYEGYGLTETSPIATANWPGSRKIGSVGKAIPGVRIEIDPNQTGGKKTEPGRVEGEIIVHGPNVMQEYLNRPEENAAVFTAGPPGERGFRTGDMGYLDKDGFLYISGRIKEQYKLENGKYVVPTPLEEELKLSPYIMNVMVYGDNKPHNVALVVANIDAINKQLGTSGSADSVLNDSKVRAFFKSEIEKYSEKFKGFESVQDFALIDSDFTTENGMLTPSLKLKRRAVLEKYGPTIDELYKKKKEAKKASANA
ncbi:MAG: long-chain fatty acid--CoA ligase [Polyangiaceae bacterium]